VIYDAWGYFNMSVRLICLASVIIRSKISPFGCCYIPHTISIYMISHRNMKYFHELLGYTMEVPIDTERFRSHQYSHIGNHSVNSASGFVSVPVKRKRF